MAVFLAKESLDFLVAFVVNVNMLRYGSSLQATPPSAISRPDFCATPHFSFGIYFRTNAVLQMISGHKIPIPNRLVNRQEETI